MSWKGVEMQVALPRTQDAGQLQDQLQQRGQLTQDQLAQAQLKQLEAKRKSVLETNEKDDVNIHEEEGKETLETSQNKRKTKEEEEIVDHPFLGKHIDYSG
ncbi:hypothetical protein CEY16_02505 [Halalkalibacillus sediminis]|uniref:RNA polymerase subunit sigma n=1 Tax=Halalkalibacillus sediminis TaxID=2018042 RepID=A0A2I0QWC3_9BACI|nr:hypothetical protein [Halalkalibacillus sediminis]PKR78647.1 hypothetical protein CEY16_02505 [Halalkalibacillus sediminis]